MRHLIESQHVVDHGLGVVVLDLKDFPSGYMFHHDKPYIAQLKEYATIPYVFHMCWTDSRVDKVKYFKELGMWFLLEGKKDCESADFMHHKQTSVDLFGSCCSAGGYWTGMPQDIKEGLLNRVK